ncbi:MAG: hypothetical protein J0I07_41365, partial [Myxococcales bacterium]|nr:hypothetical protein [Myxococcales bacterium]
CVEGSRCVLLPGNETQCVALTIRKAGESCLEETSACDKGLRCVTDESTPFWMGSRSRRGPGSG